MDKVEFFEGKVHLTLADIKPKLNNQKEKRIRLDFEALLTDDLEKRAPHSVQMAFNAACKKDISSVQIAEELDGIGVSFFELPDAVAGHKQQPRDPVQKIATCQVRGMIVKRKDKSNDILLDFHINAPASKALWNWVYDFHGCELFATFDATQASIAVADPEGKSEGQGILAMEKPDPQPTMPAKNNPESAPGELCGWKDELRGVCVGRRYHTGDHTFKPKPKPKAKAKKAGK